MPRYCSTLDVGCRIGNPVFALTSLGFQNLYGLDIVEQFVRHAASIVSNAQVIVADSKNILFKSNTFDCVICHDVLEHVLRPDELINELNRVVKDGGIIHVNAANGYSIQEIIFRWSGKLLRSRSSHVQKFKRNHIENLLCKYNLQILDSREIKHCYLPFQPVINRLPFSGFLQGLARKYGKNISYGWEFYVREPDT